MAKRTKKQHEPAKADPRRGRALEIAALWDKWPVDKLTHGKLIHHDSIAKVISKSRIIDPGAYYDCVGKWRRQVEAAFPNILIRCERGKGYRVCTNEDRVEEIAKDVRRICKCAHRGGRRSEYVKRDELQDGVKKRFDNGNKIIGAVIRASKRFVDMDNSMDTVQHTIAAVKSGGRKRAAKRSSHGR